MRDASRQARRLCPALMFKIRRALTPLVVQKMHFIFESVSQGAEETSTPCKLGIRIDGLSLVSLIWAGVTPSLHLLPLHFREVLQVLVTDTSDASLKSGCDVTITPSVRPLESLLSVLSHTLAQQRRHSQ